MPSPPLLPLPQTIIVLPVTPSETSSSARPRPAFSIRTMLGRPSSQIARCSSARTSAQVITGEVIGDLSELEGGQLAPRVEPSPLQLAERVDHDQAACLRAAVFSRASIAVIVRAVAPC